MHTMLDFERAGVDRFLSIVLLGDEATGGRFSRIATSFNLNSDEQMSALRDLQTSWRTIPIVELTGFKGEQRFQSALGVIERISTLHPIATIRQILFLRALIDWRGAPDTPLSDIARANGFSDEVELDCLCVLLTSKSLADIFHAPGRVSRDLGAGRMKYPEENNIAERLIDQDFSGLEHVHPSLLRALAYISENYTNDIQLEILAANAQVSPSHLSYLFKRHLQKSFKVLLVEMRITQAVRIINQQPNKRITDLALELAFSDLSHFEKMFRRYMGVTPRDYQNKVRARS